MQGRIQELKGEGPKLNMCMCENQFHAHFGVKGYAKLGGGKLGEA